MWTNIGYPDPACACGCSSPPPPPPPGTDGCSCGTGVVPASLVFSFTSGGSSFGPYPLSYQTSRPAGLGFGPAVGWYSASHIFDPISGGNYEWAVSCSGATWTLNQCYYTGTSGGSGPRASWTMGAGGNTCSPFLLTTLSSGGGTFSTATVHP